MAQAFAVLAILSGCSAPAAQDELAIQGDSAIQVLESEIEAISDELLSLHLANGVLRSRVDELEAQNATNPSSAYDSFAESEVEDLRDTLEQIEGQLANLGGQLANLRFCVNGFMEVVEATTEYVTFTYPDC